LSSEPSLGDIHYVQKKSSHPLTVSFIHISMNDVLI